MSYFYNDFNGRDCGGGCDRCDGRDCGCGRRRHRCGICGILDCFCGGRRRRCDDFGSGRDCGCRRERNDRCFCESDIEIKYEKKIENRRCCGR